MTEHAALPQGDLRLLQTERAARLLRSSIPARLAFTWTDGTPRVLPCWFHWTGTEIVLPTYLAAPAIGIRRPAQRVAVLCERPDVAISIDTDGNPPELLLIRGRATVTEVEGITPEHALAARRYLGGRRRRRHRGGGGPAGDADGTDRGATVMGRADRLPDRLPEVRGGILPG